MIPYEIAEQVNKTINESVEYKTDLRLYGKLEHWAPARLNLNFESDKYQ
jgi:predicted transglutaminase-like cysteine proteinase